MRTFTFCVPLEWAGEPRESPPTSWLGVDGSPTTAAPGTPPTDHGPPPAVSFTFRLFPTMADCIRIERNLDDVNGDIESTVDLELAIQNRYASLRRTFDKQLWPEGRPDAKTAEERVQQERMVDVLYFSELNEKQRLILQRMTAMRDRQRVAAEWSVLVLDPPDGWADFARRPLRAGYAEAIALAYIAARSEAETALGKSQRSAP